jgi:hypothetical protein
VPRFQIFALFGPVRGITSGPDGRKIGAATETRELETSLEPPWRLCKPLSIIPINNDIILFEFQAFVLDENNDQQRTDVSPDERRVLDLEIDISQSPCVIKYNKREIGSCGGADSLPTEGNGTENLPNIKLWYRINLE